MSQSPPASAPESSLTIVDPGAATRLVDGGRPETRSLGVPVGGAADRAAWMLGNTLVGNAAACPALEIALKGPILRADGELGCVVFGAPFELSSTRQALRSGRTFTLTPGEELHVGGAPQGMRAYLGVSGGLQAPRILGSASGLTAVTRGQALSCSEARLPARFVGADCPFLQFPTAATLRVLPGRQAAWFDMSTWLGQSFAVTPASDRMGLRLQGTPLPWPAREMISEPVCPGTVQVTRDGQCIILGVDGQTIGGYPKIAQVINVDLDALGQLRPGATIRFQLVEMAQAESLTRQRRALLDEWLTRLRVAVNG